MIEIRTEAEQPIHPIDFGLQCIRDLRHLKESQERGEIDNQLYLYFSQDLNQLIQDIIEDQLGL